jgi:hypothetical protein
MTRAKDISKIVTDAALSGTLDVTGTVTAGGLTLGHQNYIAWADSGGTTRSAFQFDTDTLKIGISGNIDNTIIRSNGADRIKADSNGDISFYEDTGTTPKFFWDASTERLGIGTASPSFDLQLNKSSAPTIRIEETTNNVRLDLRSNSDHTLIRTTSNHDMRFNTNQVDRMTIKNNGNVGINETSPDAKLHITTNDNATLIKLESTDADAIVGPRMDFVRNSSSPADNDETGVIRFRGENSASEELSYVEIVSQIKDVTDGTEDGNIKFRVMVDGTLRELFTATRDSVIVNQDTIDIDFRVESDNNTHALFVQGSDGNVGIGTSSPERPFHVFSSGIVQAFIETSGSSARLAFESSGSNTNAGNLIAVDANDMWIRTNNTERMRIDSSGNVGIGTSSPAPASGSDTTLEIAGSDGPSLTINDTGQAEKYSLLANANDLKIYYGSTPMVSFQNDGNVGIGTANPVYKFVVSAGGASGIEFGPAYSGTANLVQHYSRSGASYVDAVNVAAQHRFNFSGSERMRIDSSGNLLVGVTSTSIPGVGNTTLGVSLRGGSNNSIAVSRGADVAGYFNRNTNNGTILSLRQDGVQIGNIGTPGNQDMFLASGNIGLLISGSGTVDVYPCDNNGSARDNVADFGQVGARWDDIYATNGTIQTSDRNEKQDIEELSDAEQRVAVVAKGLMRKFRWKDKVAEKGDNARTHFGIIAQDLQDAFTAEGLDAGDYAMFTSTTWWEKEISVDAVEADQENGIEAKDAYIYIDRKNEATEGYTERTRLGVRYNQLLAFIISAI